MDLWYIARRERGDLPSGLEEASVVDIARHYDFLCHAVRGDYTRPRPSDANMFRGIGFENHPDYPYRIELHDLKAVYNVDGEETETTIETARGTLRFRLRYSSNMRSDGISLPFKLAYAIEEPGDLDCAAELFEHLEVVPTPGAYRDFSDRIGDTGIAVAQGSIAASPLHLLLHELMPMDRFFFWYYDRYHQLKEFEARITPFFDQLLDAVVASGAETALWGSNFDRDLTWPVFFDRDIAPWLIRVREKLHDAGIRLLCHTDGENSKLFDSYRAVKFDVAESLCVAPMTELDLMSQRREFGDDVTIWGGIPSLLLLADSTDTVTFDAYLRKLETEMDELAPERSRLILGVSDNVPPDCDMGRLAQIGEWAREL